MSIEEMRNWYKTLILNSEGNTNLEDLTLNGKRILIWTLRKQDMSVRNQFISLRLYLCRNLKNTIRNMRHPFNERRPVADSSQQKVNLRFPLKARGFLINWGKIKFLRASLLHGITT
jgi:hypothetical protein